MANTITFGASQSGQLSPLFKDINGIILTFRSSLCFRASITRPDIRIKAKASWNNLILQRTILPRYQNFSAMTVLPSAFGYPGILFVNLYLYYYFSVFLYLFRYKKVILILNLISILSKDYMRLILFHHECSENVNKGVGREEEGDWSIALPITLPGNQSATPCELTSRVFHPCFPELGFPFTPFNSFQSLAHRRRCRSCPPPPKATMEAILTSDVKKDENYYTILGCDPSSSVSRQPFYYFFLVFPPPFSFVSFISLFFLFFCFREQRGPRGDLLRAVVH